MVSRRRSLAPTAAWYGWPPGGVAPGAEAGTACDGGAAGGTHADTTPVTPAGAATLRPPLAAVAPWAKAVKSRVAALPAKPPRRPARFTRPSSPSSRGTLAPPAVNLQ